MNINEKIKAVRTSLTLSQAEIAEKLGIKQSYYSAIERGEKEPSDNVLKMLFENLDVNEAWFNEGKGHIFNDIKSVNKHYSKIGVLRKKTFESTLSKEDQSLITALRELPELTAILNSFNSNYDIEYLETLSSIGAAWYPGLKIPISYSPVKNLDNEAYEKNMSLLLRNLSDKKKAVIEFRGKLIEFLKIIEPLNQGVKIKLPGE